MNIPQKNWLEWTVFFIGLGLVGATLGYLVYDALTLGDAPPAFEIRLGLPERRAQNFVIPVSIINRGDEAAAAVRVEVTLERDGEEQIRAEFEIDLAPRHATRLGWVAFPVDPNRGRLRAQVLGYRKP